MTGLLSRDATSSASAAVFMSGMPFAWTSESRPATTEYIFELWEAAVAHVRPASLSDTLSPVFSWSSVPQAIAAHQLFRRIAATEFRSFIPPRYEERMDHEDGSLIRALVLTTSLPPKEALEKHRAFRRAIRTIDKQGILSDVVISLDFT